MNSASPSTPYPANPTHQSVRCFDRIFVTAMTAGDSMPHVKKGRRFHGETGSGDGVTAISRAFTCSRAPVFVCACNIFNKWCHAVTELIGVQFTNELSRLLGDSAYRHLPSSLSCVRLEVGNE